MKCLVTGCAGFIGSHLSERLLRQGHQVVGIDTFTPYYQKSYKLRNIETILTDPRFELVEQNINQVDLPALLDSVEIVYHIAGQPGVRKSWGETFRAYSDNNVLATERLLYACVGKPLQRFVLAGSSSVYGDAPEMPWKETTCPQPRSPYAITKLASEYLCNAYRQDFDVPTAIVRYFTVYGPRQRPDMAFHRFIRATLENRAIKLFGSGDQTRDFTYIDDIVTGTIAAADADGAIGGIYNLGGGSRISVNGVIELLAEVMEQPIQVERLDVQAGDVRHTWADTTRAQQVLNFQPQVMLAEGLAHETAWMKQLLASEPSL